MDKVLIVAQREFYETIKTKMFLISSVLLPVLMVVLMLLTGQIMDQARQEKLDTRVIALLDETGLLTARVSSAVDAYNQEYPNQPFAVEAVESHDDPAEESLRARVNLGEIYAYLIVPGDLLASETSELAASELAPADRPAVEFGRADGQLSAMRAIHRFVESAVWDLRREEAGIAPEVMASLQRPVEFRAVDVRSGRVTSGNELAQMMTPFAFMFLLFMATMNISQGLLTTLIEEKSTRVVEVLLSAVSPTQLLAGKVLGMVAVGALLIAIWGVLGYAGAAMREMDYLVSPFRLTYMVLYFVPGFLFFAASLAAIGSACNTLKEAQSMSFPLTIVLIVPMMLWWYIVEQPHSAFAIALSYIPPLTPFMMILRICADPQIPMIEIIMTLLLLWASVIAMIWAAGKIFRVGVLMYGKAPSFGELLRWVRYA